MCLVHWWSMLHMWENLQFPQFPCLVHGKPPCHNCAIISTSISCQCVGRNCRLLPSGPIHFALTTERQLLFDISLKCSAWVTSSDSSEHQMQHAVSTWRSTTSLRECSTWPFDSYIRQSLDRYGRAHCLAGTLAWTDLPRFLFVRLHEVNGSWNRYWPWRRSCSTHCQRSSWNKGNPWHLWKGTGKYGTSMHCLSGSQWKCVPAIVVMGQKTGSILTMQHWSEQVFFFFLFFLEWSTFCFLLVG